MERKKFAQRITVFSPAPEEGGALLTGQVSCQESTEFVDLWRGKLALWDRNKDLIALLEEDEGVLSEFYIRVPSGTALGGFGLELKGAVIDVEGASFSEERSFAIHATKLITVEAVEHGDT
jgi:hypothetical protein